MTEPSERIFHLLEQMEGSATTLESRDSDIQLPAGRVSHAVDGQRRRMLLVPLAGNETDVEDVGSRGVVIRPRQLVDGAVTRRYLAVVCEREGLRDLFAVVCDDMLEAMNAKPYNPGPTCQSVLDRWRDLLGPPADRLLGENAVAGILAELHFLERLAATDPPSALEYWLGPAGGRFDFVAGNSAAEIKATTRREHFEVEIHGSMQLDTSGGEALYLYAEQLERVTDTGDSLPAAIRRLREAGVSAHGLFDRLGRLGYSAADEAAYETVRFKVLATRSFKVSEDFPRIVRSAMKKPSILDCVTDLRYSVDLSNESTVAGGLNGLDEIVALLLESKA